MISFWGGGPLPPAHPPPTEIRPALRCPDECLNCQWLEVEPRLFSHPIKQVYRRRYESRRLSKLKLH